MDRRVVAGWISIALGMALQPGDAIGSPQQQPPSQLGGPVGLGPLDSISDSINGPAGSAAAPSPAAIPRPMTNPTTSGPVGASPGTPVGPDPVGFTTLPPLNQSLDRGYPSGISAFFRRSQPKQAGTIGRITPAQFAPPIASPDLMTPGYEPLPPLGPVSGARRRARPAPYANQIPDAGRPRTASPTDLPGLPTAGRPMLRDDPKPGQPRAQAKFDDGRLQGSRPQPSGGPRPPGPVETTEPIVIPPPAVTPIPADPVPEPMPPRSEADQAPVVPGMPPALEPVTAGSPPVDAQPGPGEPTPPPTVDPATPPPIGTDPLAAVALPVVVKVEPVVPTPERLPPSPSQVNDADVVQTGAEAGADPTSLKLKDARKKPPAFASQRAAIVGEEVITVHELQLIVQDQWRKMTGQELPPTNHLSAEERAGVDQIAEQSLKGLIDQCLIIQEAKRKIKDPKGLKHFYEMIEKRWKEEELGPLLRETSTGNESDLKVKLAEQGKSLVDIKEQYRKRMMASEFMMGEIHKKITCDVIEMKAYYNEHLKDFEQPAKISWREIEVDVTRYPDRADARKQAEAILARLARKEDFASLAKQASNGPTATQGGLYADMHPGGYGIPSVNDELSRLPIGQVSPIIEAPSSFHIVRVESRREAGPLHYDEVQTKIRDEVFHSNYVKAQLQYIAKLRSRAVVRTIFDPVSKPSTVAAKPQTDASVRPASSR